MQWSDISFQPSARTLRQFAAFWLIFFGGLACWQAFRSDNVTLALVLAVLALTIGPLGLVWPQAVQLIYVGSMIVAFPMGWTVSRVLLACLFYGLFTPIAFIFRLAGRDVLGLRARPEQATYWTAKPMTNTPQGYFRQF